MTNPNHNHPLHDIILAKRSHLAQRKQQTPMDAMRALASMQKRPQPVLSTVPDERHVLLFGQIRYDAPSYDPVTQALRYAQVGLDGLALFTDNTIYDNGSDDLALVARAVDLPIILQNYIFDEYQVVEARAAGASALTLVAELLDPAVLRTLISATQRNRMSAIVRVQTSDEMQATLEVCPPVIELGGRDADGNTIDLARIASLRPLIPSTCRVLLYNRLRSFDEAAAVAPFQPDAVLVNDSLLAQDDAVPRLRALFGG